MRIRPVLAVASVFLAATVAGAPAAMASGNAGQYWSVTELTFGKFNTMIGLQNDGSGYWWMEESYGKAGGGTITAQYGFNYHGYSYNKGWFTQSAGDSSYESFNGLGFNDCSNVVGWLKVQNQGTFYNAPVTIC